MNFKIGISWHSSQHKTGSSWDVHGILMGFPWDFHRNSPRNPHLPVFVRGAETKLQVSQATASAELGEMPALEVE